MKTLVVAFFTFVVFGAIHCEAFRTWKWTVTAGECHYKGHAIRNGESKSLLLPCVQATCAHGRVEVEHCEPRPSLTMDKRCFEYPGLAAAYPSCCPTYACM
ncbi:complement inhibitor CirpT2-like [Amblyomma americanum]|uniref:Single domain-containing protein n=1 Tax=Amblyomma americanum TaxID=6943 RepID=A0AAQ4DI29_AMBAM